MEINELKEFVEKAWSKETSERPEEWSEDNPASGHCLISALAFQDEFEGDILQSKIAGIYSYYWNRLPDGTEIELTRSQLPEYVVVPQGKVRPRTVLDRALIRARPDVIEKYEILKRKIEEARRESGR